MSKKRSKNQNAAGLGNVFQSAFQKAQRYRAVSTLMNELPEDGKWSAKERERWLKAIEGAVDWHIEVVEPWPEAEAIRERES